MWSTIEEVTIVKSLEESHGGMRANPGTRWDKDLGHWSF
jgi:hypothetical protein